MSQSSSDGSLPSRSLSPAPRRSGRTSSPAPAPAVPSAPLPSASPALSSRSSRGRSPVSRKTPSSGSLPAPMPPPMPAPMPAPSAPMPPPMLAPGLVGLAAGLGAAPAGPPMLVGRDIDQILTTDGLLEGGLKIEIHSVCPTKVLPFILQKHQIIVPKFIGDNPAPILLWHGLGSGKTITSIMSVFQLGATMLQRYPLQPGESVKEINVIVIANKALLPGYNKEIDNNITELQGFYKLPYPGHAIRAANEFKLYMDDYVNPQRLPVPPPHLAPDWTRDFIKNEIVIPAGRDMGVYDRIMYNIPRLKTDGIAFDLASIQAALQRPIPPGPGGRKTKSSKKNKKKTKKYKGGAPLRDNIKKIDNINYTFKFKSINGKYSSDFAAMNEDILGSPNNTIIVWDEFQLMISEFYNNLRFLSKMPTQYFIPFRQMNRQHRIVEDPQGTFVNDARGAITDSRAFNAGCDYARSMGGAEKSDFIYRTLCKARIAGVPMVLLSATPFSNDPVEFAILSNILGGNPFFGSVGTSQNLPPEVSSAEPYELVYNKNTFNSDFSATNLPSYDYTLSNADLLTQMNQVLAVNITNKDKLENAIKSCFVSYFGNAPLMMPILQMLPNMPTLYNELCEPYINIVECNVEPPQLVNIKLIKHFINRHGSECFSLMNMSMYDYTTYNFTLDMTSTLNLGRVTRRKRTTEPLMAGLDVTPDNERIKAAIFAQYFVDIKRCFADPKWSPTITPDTNAKFHKLLENITSAPPDSRHVIYIDSKYSAAAFGRILLNQLGMRMLIDTSTPTETADLLNPASPPFFSYLRGAMSEDDDLAAAFSYGILHEGQTENLGELIDLYNNPDPNNRLKILLINTAVAEGVTLKNTDYIHIVSLPSSISKLRQIVARVYRNCTRLDGRPIIPYLYVLTNITRDGGAPLGSINKDASDRIVPRINNAAIHAIEQVPFDPSGAIPMPADIKQYEARDAAIVAALPDGIKDDTPVSEWHRYTNIELEDRVELNHDIIKLTNIQDDYYSLIPFLKILKENAVDTMIDAAGNAISKY